MYMYRVSVGSCQDLPKINLFAYHYLFSAVSLCTCKRVSKQSNADILLKLTSQLFSIAGLQALANAVAETQTVLLNEVRFIYRDSHL